MEGCDGSVVAKKGKRGRSFYACTKYPDCTFVSYFQPAEKPCPKCGKALFIKREKGKGIIHACLNESCGFSEAE
jgi:DNA topoisomerase-1